MASVWAQVGVTERIAAPSAPAEQASVAVVVLVGETGQNRELAELLFELLEREGVRPLIERKSLFEPNTLLGELNADTGVRVYITLSEERSVRLYFRGPYGKRFILRELQLSGGLNEVGRESIARVVATSTVALLDSSALAGIDRETAQKTLARETNKEVAPKPTAKPTAPPITPKVPFQRAWMKFELGARGVTRWVGAPLGVNVGIGAEVGLILWPSGWFFHRERLVGEYLAPQTINAPELDVSVETFALRGGVDLGVERGAHALMLGLGAGMDIFWNSPKNLRNEEEYGLDPPSTGVVPVVRTELRYEVSLSSLLVAATAFADIALRGTRYDVRDSEDTRHSIAEPSRVRPGLALVLAWQPSFYE